ncbi:DUF424 domain-containing protein [Candidatus Pacearchaeota archaeon CG10_big_fil_rev_8_21_14_0_10_32_14]|nr:MAG: DUF424 domain-containing protein [Candidatus Pacearchaeota archaeon CG10_big_fil_rev_8_21_14_0_10_32_14]
MNFKLHKSYRDVVSICDNDIIGKTFEEEKLFLDVKESFYKGEDLQEEDIRKRILFHTREDATFNIVGKESIAIALDMEIISQEGIKTVQGIPFALVLM